MLHTVPWELRFIGDGRVSIDGVRCSKSNAERVREAGQIQVEGREGLLDRNAAASE